MRSNLRVSVVLWRLLWFRASTLAFVAIPSLDEGHAIRCSKTSLCLSFQHLEEASTNIGFTTAAVQTLLRASAASASALTTYAGMVAYYDRPRGTLQVDVPSQVMVKPSTVPGAGLGLFAATFLPRGTVLGAYPGVVLPMQQHLEKPVNYPDCLSYIFRFSDNQMVVDPTNHLGILGEFCTGGNPSQFGSVWLFETFFSHFLRVPTTLTRINEPPRGKDVNVVTIEDLQKRTITLALERDVYEGEEFFIDYGLSYDRSRYVRLE